MSFKKTLAAVGLATMAGWAPLQSKANETNQTDKATVRQEQFQAVLRTVMTAKMSVSKVKNELVKYIDFPSFIPVTKDGKFDEEKCQQWVKDFDLKGNYPHIKKYLETLKSAGSLKSLDKDVPGSYEPLKTLDTASRFDGADIMDKAHIELAQIDTAYAELAENIAKGDKEKEKKLLNAYLPLRATMEEMPEKSPARYILGGLLVAFIGLCYGAMDTRDKVGMTTGSLFAVIGAGLVIYGALSKTTDADRLAFLEKTLPKAYRAGYTAFVEHTIASQKQEIVSMSVKQVAEMVKLSQKEQAQKQSQPVSPSRESR